MKYSSIINSKIPTRHRVWHLESAIQWALIDGIIAFMCMSFAFKLSPGYSQINQVETRASLILAASLFSGVISIFLRRLLAEQAVTIYGDGMQTRDFIHVADVAKANVLAATRAKASTGLANICSGHSTSLIEIVELLHQLAPESAFPVRYLPARVGDIRHSGGNATAAFTSLGFKAKNPSQRPN